MNKFNLAKLAFKEIFWPNRCCICDRAGDILCQSCYNNLEFIDSNRACKRCGGAYGKDICTECNDVMLSSLGLDAFPFITLRHALVANEDSQKIITTYKDKGQRCLCFHIAQIMSRYIDDEIDKNFCYITYIPDTISAVKCRGFDHSQEIANKVGEVANMEVIRLFEPPKTTDQRKLTKRERIENMQGSLRINNSCLYNANYQLLIIDDICTTGSTMYAAALQAIQGGFKDVYGLTFARVFE